MEGCRKRVSYEFGSWYYPVFISFAGKTGREKVSLPFAVPDKKLQMNKVG